MVLTPNCASVSMMPAFIAHFMWKAFVECCCGAPERPVATTRTAIRPKAAGTPTRAKSSAARTSDRQKVIESESNGTTERDSKDKSALIDTETSESMSESTPTPIASPSAASSNSSDPEPVLCKTKNYLFYQNKIPSKPSPGGLIDDIHKNWFGDYRLLEYHHGYIQWLFPVFESGGMSFHSDRLSKEEAGFMRRDLRSSIRLVKSYKLMLDFYGMKLLDYSTGEIARNPKNYKSRYSNLNTNGHNYLRISRMLMSLGELGFVRYKTPWMDFMIHELDAHDRLSHCRRSYSNFWRPLCDPTSPGYKQKTRETAEDREESIFFQIMTSGGDDWESIKRELDAYPYEPAEDSE